MGTCQTSEIVRHLRYNVTYTCLFHSKILLCVCVRIACIIDFLEEVEEGKKNGAVLLKYKDC